MSIITISTEALSLGLLRFLFQKLYLSANWPNLKDSARGTFRAVFLLVTTRTDGFKKPLQH